MKTKKTIIIVFALAQIITSYSLKSQICSCPFTITNILKCDIIAHYDVVDASCGLSCTGPTVMVNSGSSITTACCTVGLDVYLAIFNPFSTATTPVNGVSSSGCNLGYLNPTLGPITLSSSLGCNSPGFSTITISWTCSGVTISEP
ncbi:MAG: hypothetical protein PSX36_09595 [bacterium]|nr:hypothetical protein [bacterium]